MAPRAQPIVPLEKVIQRAIIQTLRAAGFMVEKIGNGSARRKDKSGNERFVKLGATPGFPDLFVVGLAVHLEVKRPGAELTEAQVLWHAAAKRAGARVFVVESPQEALAIVQAERARQREIDRLADVGRDFLHGKKVA